ncbi:hypothetical protein GM3709_2312 [Geminocystis sp. NIES-3709]|nr:hypothetical protein GM3709_2312 [Geminocystis sp. NIES-3709]
MKNIALMVFGYVLITALVNTQVVEKTSPCDILCTQSASK